MRAAGLATAVLAVAAAAVVPQGAALAHEEVPGVRAVIESVTPPLPAGVTVEAHMSVADQLVAENRSTTDLFVLGDEGEPFLRIGRAGVFANVRSPAWHRSNDPTGAAVPPPGTDPAAPPLFARVSTEPAWGWFDHRLHRRALARAPEGARPGRPVVLERWTVPMRYGDAAMEVKGRREYVAPRGSFTSRVVSAPPELRALVLPGLVPAVTVTRADPASPPITVLGEEGEPLVRLSATGVDVNEASPTWVFTAKAKGGAPPAGVAGPDEPPRWVRQAAGQVTWLDRRGQAGKDDEHGRPGERLEWRVPVLVGERRVEVVAETVWREAGGVSRERGDGSGSRWWVAGAGAVVAAVFAMFARRRGQRADQ